ncbi:hypothetical protein LOK49_LG04G01394 [Camellia lanceoleosa]|uniref:Uncharacterized protein n=1 Tax=Camellia lanceoleosa TaxID=1840588 RepID=A0ACC0I4B0_9ERIC|nr:hypothetical protein LOK49_LG04G01394 [Camellia lanceoleosa]
MRFSSTMRSSDQFRIPKFDALFLLLHHRHHHRCRFNKFDLRTYWMTLIEEINQKLDEAVPVKYPQQIYEACCSCWTRVALESGVVLLSGGTWDHGTYWLCEHSSIIEPQTENMFPRFMKWDIGKLLIKGQGVDLSGPVKFQVKVDRLRSFEYEREMLGAEVVEFGDVKADVVECAGGDDAFVEECGINDTHMSDEVRKDDLDFGFDDVREECSSWEGREVRSPVGRNEATVLRGATFVNDNEG